MGKKIQQVPWWFVGPTDTPFKNVNRMRFGSGTYDNNPNNRLPPGDNVPPTGGNRPPPGSNGPPPGDNGSTPGNNGPSTESNGPPPGGVGQPSDGGNGPYSNTNSGLASSVTPRVGTVANLMQSNIRAKTEGWIIRKKKAAKDDISCVSSESPPDTTPIVNNIIPTTALVVLCTSLEKDADDCSWNTVTAVANAPLGNFRELLIPDRPNDDSSISRKEWLDDIKYCLQHRYVYCHQFKEWVTRAMYSKRYIQGVGCHWNKKCKLCQTIGYNKRIEKGLCHVIWNGQSAILNEVIRSPASSPIPFDIDYSVVPELDIPKHIEG
jgi:hypothetical protein